MAIPMQPPHFSLKTAIRPCILAIPAFVTSTSDTFQPRTGILLDANENSLGSGFASFKFSLPESHHDGNCDPDLNEKDYLRLDGFTSESESVTVLHRYPSAAQFQLKKLVAESRGLPGNSSVSTVYPRHLIQC